MAADLPTWYRGRRYDRELDRYLARAELTVSSLKGPASAFSDSVDRVPLEGTDWQEGALLAGRQRTQGVSIVARPANHRARFMESAENFFMEIQGQQLEGHYTRAQVDEAWAYIRRGMTILGYPHFRREEEEATPRSEIA